MTTFRFLPVLFARISLPVFDARPRPTKQRIVAASLTIGALAVLGCDVPDRPILREASRGVPSTPLEPERTKPVEVFEPPGGTFEGDWETWEIYFRGKDPIGFAHVTAQQVPGSGLQADSASQSDVRYQMLSQMMIERGEARILQRLEQTSLETGAGRLLSFEAALRVGPAVTRYIGEVIQDELLVQVQRGSSQPVRRVKWKPAYRGTLALEQSLRRRPMTKAGERRSVKMLQPGRFEIVTARMVCRGTASIPMLDGTAVEAIEVECQLQTVDQQPRYSTFWTDREGRLLRSFSPALGVMAYRTDLATVKQSVADTLTPIALKVSGSLKENADLRRVAFEIRPVKEGETIDANEPLVPPAPHQFIRIKNPQLLQVLTTKQESEPPKSLIASDLSETEADVRPNFLIDCNASLIRQLASAAIGARRLSERELAIELTQTVNRTVAIPEQQSAFQRGTAAEFGLIPASTVAQRAVGDATGRSILLAALLRAKQIPARIAFGLRMERSDDDRDRQERQERLVYHAWTIAAVNGQWLPLDPEDGGIASPNRLTLTTTNLASDQEVKAFVPLLEKVGRLRVKIVGQR